MAGKKLIYEAIIEPSNRVSGGVLHITIADKRVQVREPLRGLG